MMASASAGSPSRSNAPSDRPSDVAESCASESSWRWKLPCELRKWIASTPASATRKIADTARASCRPSVMRRPSRAQLPLEPLHQRVPVADLAWRAAAPARLDPHLLVVEAVHRNQV